MMTTAMLLTSSTKRSMNTCTWAPLPPAYPEYGSLPRMYASSSRVNPASTWIAS